MATALILEDFQVLRGQIVETLRRALSRTTVLEAGTIAEATRLAGEGAIDFFIIDTQLPDGSGIDFFHRIRIAHPQARALFLTSSPVPLAPEGRIPPHCQALRFLKKPFSPVESQAVVREMVEAFGRSSAGASEAQQNLLLLPLNPADLIPLHFLANATGVVEFRKKDGTSGRLHFFEGRVIHAETGVMRGVEAFREMAIWEGTSFSELTVPVTKTPTIGMDLRELARRELGITQRPVETHTLISPRTGSEEDDEDEDDERNIPEPVAAPKVLFAGSHHLIPFIDALRCIQRERVSGVLLLERPDAPLVELYCRDGGVVLATTRDVEAYISTRQVQMAGAHAEMLPEASAHHLATGCPVFLSFYRRHLLSAAHTQALCNAFTQRLIRPLWLAPELHLRFTLLPRLPDFLEPLEASPLEMDDWALENWRHVPFQSLAELEWSDFSGVPAYTRHGYARTRRMSFNENEIAFLCELVKASTLEQVAVTLGIPKIQALHHLLGFLLLQILEYWPGDSMSASGHASQSFVAPSTDQLRVPTETGPLGGPR